MSRSEDFRFAALIAKPAMGPADLLLLDEACRLVDRLDRFDALLAGDQATWLTVHWPYEDSPAELVISSTLTEARAHVSELRQVLKALGLPEAKASAAGPKSGLDELRSRREKSA